MVVKNGISVTSVDIDEVTNRLTCTLSDGTTKDCGTVNVVADVTKIAYTNADEPTVTNVKTALDKALDKVDGTLSEDLTANVAMGNVTVGRTFTKGTNLEDVIREMLTQYIKPVVNLLLNPSTTLYNEITDTVESITLNATVTKKTSAISKIEFFVNNSLVHTITSNVADGGTFTYIYRPSTPINDDTSFRVVVTDVEGGEGTMSKTITFVPNSYYGIIDASIGEPTEAIIKTLNKVLKTSKAYTYEGITTDWGKVCYCYDKSMGDLVSIKDPINSLNYTSEFAKTTVIVDGIEMLCYTKLEPSNAENVTLRFE